MSDWWPALCFFVFLTHMPFFAWRYQRTREPRFAATTVTFALLTLTYGLRVLVPEIRVDATPLWQWARVPAWASAAVSIGLLAQHHLHRLRPER